VSDGENNAFVTGHLQIDSVTLWIDQGTTLYVPQSHLYQKTGNCGSIGISDSGACTDFITLAGTSRHCRRRNHRRSRRRAAHWQRLLVVAGVFTRFRAIDGSIGNPTLINIEHRNDRPAALPNHAAQFTKVPRQDHSYPADGDCSTSGKGFHVWASHSHAFAMDQQSGRRPDPEFRPQHRWHRPRRGENVAQCGVIACSTISTGDDQIAIKGGHLASELVVAAQPFRHRPRHVDRQRNLRHDTTTDGVVTRGVENVSIYDLTIDADSRPVGSDATAADFNGHSREIRREPGRPGQQHHVQPDLHARHDQRHLGEPPPTIPNSPERHSLTLGSLTFQNIHHVTCMGLSEAVVTLEGSTLPCLSVPSH